MNLDEWIANRIPPTYEEEPTLQEVWDAAVDATLEALIEGGEIGEWYRPEALDTYFNRDKIKGGGLTMQEQEQKQEQKVINGRGLHILKELNIELTPEEEKEVQDKIEADLKAAGVKEEGGIDWNAMTLSMVKREVEKYEASILKCPPSHLSGAQSICHVLDTYLDALTKLYKTADIIKIPFHIIANLLTIMVIDTSLLPQIEYFIEGIMRDRGEAIRREIEKNNERL